MLGISIAAKDGWD